MTSFENETPFILLEKNDDINEGGRGFRGFATVFVPNSHQ